MLHCLPQCPTVRRQLREEVRKAGWTDEYLRKVIDTHPEDIGEDLDPSKIYRKVKPGRRKIIHKVPLSPRKQRVTSKDLEHDDRYKEKRQKDYPDKIVQDSIRITDYKEIIDDDDEKPVATLKQETVYYTEKKEVTHVAPLVKRVSPRVIKRPQIQQEREIESPIEDQRLIFYEKEKVNDIATTYSRTESESSIEDQKQIDYEKEKVDDIAIISSSAEESPGTSTIVEDKKRIQNRDDSPDSYYKYTPEKLPSDWPHDGCDQNCPAKILKGKNEKFCINTTPES
ncbi:hypothetical protein M0804_004721 [Polistes exclamans]|nr:hypothetical protein M0804_004721 [Polistes exclamans]